MSGKHSYLFITVLSCVDSLWKELEIFAQMRLPKNFVTWRHEKYADVIHKINSQTLGFLVLCCFGFFLN